MASYLTVCRFIPTAGGTTDWTYSSAVGGYQSPSAAGAVNGAIYRYRAESADLTQWEIGYGAFASGGGGIFSRTVVQWNSSGTTSKISFSVAPQVAIIETSDDITRPQSVEPCGRLTLTTATPETTADVTAATILYYTPYKGDIISLYDGSNWVPASFVEVSIPLTTTQSGTTHTNTTIDGLTDTSQLCAGMQVTGTNVAANTVINSISSSTAIVVNNATTGSATNTMTFKLPPSKVHDVWGYLSAGTVKLEFLAWTSDTARATALTTQNGVDVKTGDATRRLLGTIRTTTTAGQTEDSIARRFVSNRYKDVARAMQVNDATATWVYSTATWRQANANTGNQLDYVCCVARPIQAVVVGQVTSGTTVNSAVGIGVDAIPAASAAVISLSPSVPSSGLSVNMWAYYAGTPGVGRHFITWIEIGSGGGTQTWLGTVAPWVLCGIVGTVSG